VIWLIVFLAVVLALIGATMAATRIRSAALKRRFGSEYDRSLDQEGDRHGAEAVLRGRAKQRDGLVIRDLTPEAHARYTEQWYVVQARFVDDPRQTLAEAAELVALVMHERGYPVDGPDDCGDYVSVDYPEHAADYRMAQAIYTGGRPVTIDDLRQAIQDHRSLFDELLGNCADFADDAAEPTAARVEHDVS
jgi:hypothetical protein